MRKKSFFFVFLFRFFSNFEQNIFRLLAKKLQKFVKTNFSVSTGTTCGFKLFLKVLNRFGFSAETFGMVLKMLSTCPDENLQKKYIFLFFLSEFFSDLGEKLFKLWPKNFKNLSKLPSTSPEEQFVAWFFLSFQTFRIFCRNIWHGSQNSIYVSGVKTAEKTVFLVFSRIFSNFEQKFFRLLAKKLQKVFKITYVSRGIVCSLKFFCKVLNRFGVSAETFGLVLKILSTCPEQKLRKKQFFFVLFSEFFRIMSETFSDFWPKNFKKNVKTTFCVSTGTTCGFKLF